MTAVSDEFRLQAYTKLYITGKALTRGRTYSFEAYVT